MFNFLETDKVLTCCLNEVEQFAGQAGGVCGATELWSGERLVFEGVLVDTVYSASTPHPKSLAATRGEAFFIPTKAHPP